MHDAEGRPLLRFQTLGAATILVGDSRMQGSAGTMFSLLLRVGYAPGMVVDRDELVAMLWPDYEALRGRANLRQALYKLRSFGVRIAMNGSVVQVDDAQFVRTFSLIRTTEAFDRDVTLGHEPFGTFLPGFVVPWAAFQLWIDEQREAIHADIRRVLVEQLRRRRDRADWGGAEALARSLLQFDSLNEEATLTIAECTALSGSKSEAIAILDRYLAELGPLAGEIRLPATLLKRRIAEPSPRARLSFAPTERHFVGRDAELAELTLAMRRARWHDGNAVLLHGAAGIGKSRLAHELSKVAEIEGVRVTQASCREGDLERTLSLFLELVPELLGLSGALGCAPDSMAALRRLVPQERGAMTGEGAAQLPPREPMPSALTLRRAIVDLLSAVSDEKPMLLIVEDVHWIDEHSWEVLTDLIDRLSSMRVFVVMTSREPHARPHRPQRVSPALIVKRVPALTAEHCVELSRAIGEDLSAPVTEELSEWFVRACEGNPLFLRSLVNHWIETGEAGGVPPTLHGVIELRLSQLSGEALRVLQTATLLEKWATVERVVRVLELRANEMLQAIEQLEAMGALRANAGSLLVAHELVGRAARERMSRIGLVTMHRRVSESLLSDATSQNDVELLLDALAHLDASGDESGLVSTTVAALPMLVRAKVPHQALLALRRVFPLALDAESLRRVKSVEARLLLSAGAYSSALRDSLEGLSLPLISDRLNDDSADTALSLVESRSRADSSADRKQLIAFTVAVAELSHLAASTRIRAADIGLVIASNESDTPSAVRLFNAVGLSDEESLSNDAAGRVAIVFHTIFGRRDFALHLAENLFRRALANPISSNSYQDAMRAGFSLRIVDSGDLAFEALALAHTIAVNSQLPLHAMNAAWILCHLHLEREDISTARRWLVEVDRLYDEIADPIVGNFVLALRCRMALETGENEVATRWFEDFLSHQPTAPAARARAYTTALTCALRLVDDRWKPTHEDISKLRNELETIWRHGTADFTASVCADVYARGGDVESASSLLDQYLHVCRRESRAPSVRLARTVAALKRQ